MEQHKAINKKEDGCFLCGSHENMERHHIFPGRANRKLSEKYSDCCCVWLCHEHHNTPNGVHYRKQLADYFKAQAQLAFEEKYGHELFMQEFKKNYI